ncbi:carbonate dehydratase [Paenibacillus sp. 2RAB27]|uniref:carbonate dehydratase n=1 Tax=Paenibacillus sp. 2RAB27 TaxID=3232991 RepID=UPI003F965D1D
MTKVKNLWKPVFMNKIKIKKSTGDLPRGPVNLFARLISPNPITTFTPEQRFPIINNTAFISQYSSVVGDVTLSKNVYIAPNATLRADEGTPFFIGENTNIQDGVVLHGLAHEYILVDNKKYSIYIANSVSIAHGALIHGPCYIGEKVFVGFKSIIFNASIGHGSVISMDSVVTGGVKIAPNRFVPPGAHVDTQAKADSLRRVPKDQVEFAREVQRVNREFPHSYHLLFGTERCSCGVAFERNFLLKK